MQPETTGGEEQTTVRLRQALVDYLKGRGHIRTARVEEAFRVVPRHLFVPEQDVEKVYSDTHIVTKTVDGVAVSSSSQPAIMAIMLEQLDLQPGHNVLEIGAGTGYNAALMAQIVGETGRVVTVDIDQDTVDGARAHLQAAGYGQVEVVCADGYLGYANYAPYDRIILTVSAADIAAAWREQLRPGGRLVLPFKLTPFTPTFTTWSWLFSDQVLATFERVENHLESVALQMCGFMPLRGTMALQAAKLTHLAQNQDVIIATSRDVDAEEADRNLQNMHQDNELSLTISTNELWALRLWLALRHSTYCELYKNSGVGEQSPIPMLTTGKEVFLLTMGIYEDNTFSLLSRAKETDDLYLRTFGIEKGVMERLLASIRAWDAAKRPFQWSRQGTMESVYIHVYGKDAGYQPKSNEFIVKRGESQFVFGW